MVVKKLPNYHDEDQKTTLLVMWYPRYTNGVPREIHTPSLGTIFRDDFLQKNKKGGHSSHDENNCTATLERACSMSRAFHNRQRQIATSMQYAGVCTLPVTTVVLLFTVVVDTKSSYDVLVLQQAVRSCEIRPRCCIHATFRLIYIYAGRRMVRCDRWVDSLIGPRVSSSWSGTHCSWV